jgi:pyruvate dehydrogenase E2 component (dihydrolipoamide acetyltransferase)
VATEFKLPEVGEGIDGGTVVSILVAVGDTIKVDQPVIEMETDKAVIEIPSSVAGRVESINVEANGPVRVGEAILTVSSDADEAAATASTEVVAPEEPSSASEAQVQAERTTELLATEEAGAGETGPAASRPPVRRGLVPAAPSVRRLAREQGIDIHEVRGSGILGRISTADLTRHAQAPQQPAAAPGVPAFQLPDFSRWGQVERQPMSGIRKATVRSMSTAWATVPMVTHFDEADATGFEELRKRYRSKVEAEGAKLTPTAMLVRIAAAALRRFPDFNASIDTETEEVIHKDYVNITVAVDTDRGLLVPVIKNADRKNIVELAVELDELAQKARDRKLTPDEMQGGNFSISNLGGIGGTGFTPIVSPPEVAILGVSRSRFQPVYNKETGSFDARLIMPLAVTYDHRLIDGAAAARFLRWICQAIEDPFLMALEG